MKKNIVFACLLSAATALAQKNPAPFKAGDRIIFAGNSITEAGFYPTYIWLYYITHFPQQKMLVMNGGIGGDVAKQIYTRLEGDILAKKPDVLVVSFGMNDSRYFEYGMHPDKVDSVRESAVDTSLAAFQMIQKKLNAMPYIRKIMMTSSPYDETVKNPKNYFPGKSKTMEKIIDFQKAAAIKDDWAYVDLFYPMRSLEQAKQKDDSTFTLTGPDRIHPGNEGHFVMAYLFLKAQQLANKPIADIKIDAKNAKVLSSANCTIANLKTNGQTISFTYDGKSLPFPMDTTSRVWENPQKQIDALDIVPFVKEFDQEMLTITGLAAGNYSIKIDNNEVTTCTAEDLQKGLNLARIEETPQYKQAKAIMELQLERKKLEDKMRAYYWINYDYLNSRGMLFNDSEASLDSVVNAAKKDFFVASKKDTYTEVRLQSTRDTIQKQMNEMADQMYTMAQPKKHIITIQKAN